MISCAHAEDLSNVSGFFVKQSGNTVNFISISGSRELCLTYGPENKSTSVPLASVHRIVFGEDYRAQITLRDGRLIDARNVDNCRFDDSRVFSYSYFDDIGMEKRGAKEYFYRIATIVFGDAVGHFRICPHCGAIWPDVYLFCPLDGSNTHWGDPAGAISPNIQE